MRMANPSNTHTTDSSTTANRGTLVLAVVIVALLLRLLAAVLIERHVQNAGRSFLIEGDADGYWTLAQKIATGQEYSIYTPPRRVLRVPGFPLLLAGSIKLFGNSVFGARVVLAFVGAACCWLTYLLGTLLVTKRVGAWAALLAAVNPLHVGNSVLILTETWFTFWMLLSLLALTALLQAGRKVRAAINGTGQPQAPAGTACAWRLWLRAVLVGGLIGAAALVRPGFLPWLVVSMMAVMWLLRRPFPARAAIASGLLIGCGLLFLPWVLRNHSVTGHWVVTSLWSGPSLYDGLNPDADGSSDMRFFDDENLLAELSEFEMNRQYADRAVEFAQQNPGRAAELALNKARRFLSPVPNTVSSNWGVRVACIAWYLMFVALLIAGLWERSLPLEGWVIVLGPFLLFLLVHLVFVSSLRYRLPVEFPLCVLAVCGARWVLTKTQTGSGKEEE